MKKHFLLFLSAVILITVCACSKTNENESINSFLNEMPKPFLETQSGGNPALAAFYIPTDNANACNSLNDIPYGVIDSFVSKDDFYEWIKSEGNDYLSTPHTSISNYPNFYTFILNFKIPVDNLREVLIEQQRLGIEYGSQFYTDDEINILCSLNETKILEYFVSDYSIVINDKAYPPSWFYYHTPEEYNQEGITADMIEEKLELFSEFNFTVEAAKAFGEKLSDFIGEDIMLNSTINDINS